jgi:hypothetical protein
MQLMLIAVNVVASAVISSTFANAFCISNRNSLSRVTAQRLSQDDADPDGDVEDFYIEPDDSELFQSLQDTKRSMFGENMPLDDELKQSTLNAENAFLAAMLEQTSQFRQLKSEHGSDRAVEIFMERIKQEENPGYDGVEEENDDDTGTKFVEKMHEEQNPQIIDDDETSAWQ